MKTGYQPVSFHASSSYRARTSRNELRKNREAFVTAKATHTAERQFSRVWDFGKAQQVDCVSGLPVVDGERDFRGTVRFDSQARILEMKPTKAVPQL
jgi:hypothetical protein